jgi:hypothetical protein
MKGFPGSCHKLLQEDLPRALAPPSAAARPSLPHSPLAHLKIHGGFEVTWFQIQHAGPSFCSAKHFVLLSYLQASKLRTVTAVKR